MTGEPDLAAGPSFKVPDMAATTQAAPMTAGGNGTAPAVSQEKALYQKPVRGRNQMGEQQQQQQKAYACSFDLAGLFLWTAAAPWKVAAAALAVLPCLKNVWASRG